MIVYVHGQLVPIEQASVSVMDHGFLYGVGLFETMRVYQGNIFLWDEHYQRLSLGLAELRMDCSAWSQSQLHEVILQTVAANQLKDAYIRLSVTGGNEGVGLNGSGYNDPCLFIFAKEVPPLQIPPKPKTLQTISFPRQTGEGHMRFKSHNYLNNTLAKLEVGNDPGVEGLFLTQEGYLCEGIVSNLFWVSDGVLHTPALSTGILGGITRQHVMSLAKDLGIACKEGLYHKEELLGADEAFLTNSIQEIVPVSAIDNHQVAQVYGPITQKLHASYRQSVELSG
ncbi:aminodeoxychorismate lyase [Brevibacillus ginsengisoli]|uniref:aminodeoxychorismate lyase n=1 Tax=Brevibacillus ginsengisoli TaxID=363854 RepID=UPI003CF697EC